MLNLLRDILKLTAERDYEGLFNFILLAILFVLCYLVFDNYRNRKKVRKLSEEIRELRLKNLKRLEDREKEKKKKDEDFNKTRLKLIEGIKKKSLEENTFREFYNNLYESTLSELTHLKDYYLAFYGHNSPDVHVFIQIQLIPGLDNIYEFYKVLRILKQKGYLSQHNKFNYKFQEIQFLPWKKFVINNTKLLSPVRRNFNKTLKKVLNISKL